MAADREFSLFYCLMKELCAGGSKDLFYGIIFDISGGKTEVIGTETDVSVVPDMDPLILTAARLGIGIKPVGVRSEYHRYGITFFSDFRSKFIKFFAVGGIITALPA